MKKIGVLACVLLFVMSFVSAVPSINLQNTDIQPGETLLANITGNMLSQLNFEEIKFLEGRNQISFESDMFYYNGTYFYYAVIPRAGNFTLKIENIVYRDPDLKSITLEQPLEVKERPITQDNTTRTQILTVRPGLVITAGATSIILSNKGSSAINMTYGNEKIGILPGDFKNITLNPKQIFSYAIFDAYKKFSIPVFYFPLGGANQTVPAVKGNLAVSPDILQLKAIAEKKFYFSLLLNNTGNFTIEDIAVFSSIKSIPVPDVEDLESGSFAELNLTFTEREQGSAIGNIAVNYTENGTEYSAVVPVEIYIFPKNSTALTIPESPKTCNDLGGKVCPSGCNGEITYTADRVVCCFGACKASVLADEGGGGISGWMAGLLIFAALGVVGWIVYKKFKKTSPQKASEVIAKESKIYEHRVSGAVSSS